jgi:hypothetical protein
MEALRQHVHQEAADELVSIERHHGVSLPTPWRRGSAAGIGGL